MFLNLATLTVAKESSTITSLLKKLTESLYKETERPAEAGLGGLGGLPGPRNLEKSFEFIAFCLIRRKSQILTAPTPKAQKSK